MTEPKAEYTVTTYSNTPAYADGTLSIVPEYPAVAVSSNTTNRTVGGDRAGPVTTSSRNRAHVQGRIELALHHLREAEVLTDDFATLRTVQTSIVALQKTVDSLAAGRVGHD